MSNNLSTAIQDTIGQYVATYGYKALASKDAILSDIQALIEYHLGRQSEDALRKLLDIFKENRNKPPCNPNDCYCVREDLHPEAFRSSEHSIDFLRGMRDIGNFFTSKEDAKRACNLLREALGAPQII